jgi:secreted trypsin-like serine protease
VTNVNEMKFSSDSGGGLIIGNVLEGIVSYGSSECMEGPDVYTKVGGYIDWIKYYTKI